MRSTLRALLMASLCLVFAAGVFAAEKPIHERIEWSDIRVENADTSAHPRVLLIGDSIVKGYYNTTLKALKDTTACARYATSKFMSNPDFLNELTLLLKRYHFAVIHINNGLHGFGYTEEQYKDSFPAVFKIFKEYAKESVIIWVTTTPERKRNNITEIDEKSTARIRERNRIALEFMSENKIPMNDLFSLVIDHPEYFGKDGVHFNAAGKAAQGKQVAAIVLKYLSDKTP